MNLLNVIPLPGRVLMLIAFATALLGFGWVKGAEHGEAKLDAYKVSQDAATAAAEQKNRQKELDLQRNVIEAQNAAQARTKVLQVAIASARSESDGLRNDLATTRAKLSSASADAVREYANAASVILDQCQREYQDVAAKADGHASDTLMLQQAWPQAGSDQVPKDQVPMDKVAQ